MLEEWRREEAANKIAALEKDNARLRLEIGRLLRISEDFREQLTKAWGSLDILRLANDRVFDGHL